MIDFIYRNKQILKKFEITHILVVGKELSQYFPGKENDGKLFFLLIDDFKYLQIDVDDVSNQNISQYFRIFIKIYSLLINNLYYGSDHCIIFFIDYT